MTAFDLRGHGDSQKPRDAYADPVLWADDLRRIIEGVSPKQPILIGWSYGGLVVSDYLSVYGDDDIKAINLVDAISEKGTEDATRFAGEEFLALQEDLGSTDAETSVSALKNFLEICTYESLPPDEFAFMLGYTVQTPPYVRAALQARERAAEGTLRDIDIPVHLTHGEADQVVSPDAAHKHQTLLSESDLTLHPGVGHTPFWEQPAQFNSELAAFIDRVTEEGHSSS